MMTHMKMWPFVVPSAQEYPVRGHEMLCALLVAISTEPPVQEEKNDTYQMPQPDPLNPVLCKSKCSHGIYKSMDEYKDQIAIETRASSSVDVYVWSLDFSSMQHDSYHSIYFNKHYVSKEFKDIGCATQSMTITTVY